MLKRTRNILLGAGIILSLCLCILRVEAQLIVSNDLGMFSEILGYEGPKQYALLFLDSKNPLLFRFTVSKGEAHLTSVTPATDILKNVPRADLPDVAEEILTRIPASDTPVDALGFVTTEAVQKLADAFNGFYIEDQKINATNVQATIANFALSQNAIDTFNTSASWRKSSLILNSKSILFAIKDAISKGAVGAYFKTSSPFGKSCLGACGTQLVDHITP